MRGVSGEVPSAWAASDFTLRAPEPNAKHGGVLRYGILSAPAHFDVHQSGTVSNMGTQGCMYDNLIRRNPVDSGQTIIPDLAHSWEISPDQKTYTFFLRANAKWSNGDPVTAKDFILTILAHPYVKTGKAIGKIIEYSGSAIEALNSRQVNSAWARMASPQPGAAGTCCHGALDRARCQSRTSCCESSSS